MNSFRFVNLYLLQVFRGSMLLRRWLPFLKEMQIQEVQTGMNIHVITMTNLWYKCTSTNKSNWSGVCIYWHILCTFQPPNTAAPKLGMHQQNWTSGGRDHDNTRPLRVKVTHILDPTLEVSAAGSCCWPRLPLVISFQGRAQVLWWKVHWFVAAKSRGTGK